jgi:hypothetical protein
MAMNKKRLAVTELEGELVQLNALVRERRKQLVRLERCPNKDCPCRRVWRQVVEQNLASQVGEIRRRVRKKPAAPAKRRRRLRNSR